VTGSGTTECKYADGTAARMNALELKVTLYSAAQPYDGKGWRQENTRSELVFGQSVVFQIASKACFMGVDRRWAIVTHHDMVPPTGYAPPFKKTRTYSPPPAPIIRC